MNACVYCLRKVVKCSIFGQLERNILNDPICYDFIFKDNEFKIEI